MFALRGACQLIDDTYNANPDSVRAAIDVLASLPSPRILVLGDMAEVGENSDAMHAEVGAYAHAQGIDALYALGKATSHSVGAFGAGAVMFSNVQGLVQALLDHLPANILVKGSRSARMERVVQELKAKTDLAQEGHHAA
jgi:murE/murF fusion protein